MLLIHISKLIGLRDGIEELFSKKLDLKELTNIELLEALAIEEARENFHAYRRLIHGKKLKISWFVIELDNHLQQFYTDFIAGKKPKLAISMAPQHGKTSAVVDFICWLSGKNPDVRSIYTSFSERLGVRANLACQRTFDSARYQRIFPGTKISTAGLADTFGATRNRELIEFIDKEGYFRNTTVRGAISGEGLDLGVVDDPLKGREAANSSTTRQSVWEWLTDDFMTRFSENAGMLIIATRWHVDDPISRLKNELGDTLKVVSYPAIAIKDEKHRKEGDPLFPELKSLEFLQIMKQTMSSISWESLYQGDPQIVGGDIIKSEYFKSYTVLPRLEERNIYADTAMKTAERNDYSVFECWGKSVEGGVYLVDLIRGKWEAPELERRAIAFWNKHKALDSYERGTLRKFKVEDKASGTGLIQKLTKPEFGRPAIPVIGVERTKDKYTRVLDCLGYIESGYVYLPIQAPFYSDFVDECEKFTADDSHPHDDQIDPMLDAINDYLADKSSLSVWAALGKH